MATDSDKAGSNDRLALCRRIRRDCLWEYRLSDSEILAMANNGTDAEKRFLFNKILENSTDVLRAIEIFSTADQRALTLAYRPPRFNHAFFDRRHKIVSFFVTGQEVDIPALRWNE